LILIYFLTKIINSLFFLKKQTNRGLLIEEGRHPMVESIIQVPFVSNNVTLRDKGQRCQIITGPNMGGKSSYIRQVGLISIMSQIGSYVPAKKATIRIIDAIHTRYFYLILFWVFFFFK